MNSELEYLRKLVRDQHEALMELEAFDNDPSVGILGYTDLAHAYKIWETASSMGVLIDRVCPDCYVVHDDYSCPFV